MKERTRAWNGNRIGDRAFRWIDERHVLECAFQSVSRIAPTVSNGPRKRSPRELCVTLFVVRDRREVHVVFRAPSHRLGTDRFGNTCIEERSFGKMGKRYRDGCERFG
jgi:hypothetical protein